MKQLSINRNKSYLKRLFKLLSFISLSLLVVITPEITLADDVRIALRAHSGIENSVKQWQATIDHLNKTIPEHNFTLHPFENISGLNQAISRKEYDFCINNPSSFIKQKLDYDSLPLATLVNKRQGKGYTRFGSVIFTRSDREDIKSLQDLKGKAVIAVDELAFGGWRVAWDELLKNNINPFNDFNSMSFAGGPQQIVVYSVRDGLSDAGIVRTDMLERLAASGDINLNDFKILGAKKTKGFPFSHSTELYPEWVFSTARKVNSQLKTKVVSTLFSIKRDSSAALNGKYIGWISPLDYSSVENLLQRLRVGPFDIATMDDFERLESQYALPVLLISIAFGILTFLALYMLRQNKQIKNAQRLLQEEVISRQSIERQLMHIQKMESLGQLTGGIAHDFNNMLASMLGYTELSLDLKTVRDDSKLQKYLRQVLTAGDKAKNLVSQMLAFSRTENNKTNTETLLVSNFITDAQKLLRPLLPSNIKFDSTDNTEELYINVHRVMLDQVLMNICINSKDAMTGMKGSGRISISVQLQNYDDAQCNSCHQDISGTYVVIDIKDNGMGIDPNSMKRLFEPFYTTKEVGQGTGMGLSMAHGIIHEHNGHIIVESTLNLGTSVKILLPEVSGFQKKPSIKKTQPTAIDTSKNSLKHIIIIDDEISITTFLFELLQRYNYKVSTFNHSQKALDYIESNHQNIDMIITDQMMPGLTGTDISSKIMKINPSIPIIMCTGYSDETDRTNIHELGITSYLEKPIETDKLLNAITSLI